MKFPNSRTFRVIGDSSVTDLAFKGSLAGTQSVLSVGSSPFVLLVSSVITHVDKRLIDDFVHHYLYIYIYINSQNLEKIQLDFN